MERIHSLLDFLGLKDQERKMQRFILYREINKIKEFTCLFLPIGKLDLEQNVLDNMIPVLIAATYVITKMIVGLRDIKIN